MTQANNQALITVIKNPEKGKVKTRLAKTMGDDKALAIYKALLQHTRNITLAVDCTRYLFYSQYINQEDDWSTNDFQKLLQVEGNLGYKMATAFQIVFQKHQKVLIIGSDCASLTTEIIADSFKQLDHHDFVLGPAEDGGYYLLGMNSFQPSVFENIEWSTETVLQRTIENIKRINLSLIHISEPTRPY